MEHLEMVEKLREKANVSYEEAKAALEACDWDLLDALLMLESEGKLHEMEEAAYTTREEKAPEAQEAPQKKKKEKGVFASLIQGLAGLIKKGNAISLDITKNGETRLSLPLTVVVIALIFMFWWMLIAAVLAMVFGYRYSLRGSTVDNAVNSAMDKAGDFVDNVVKPNDVKVVREESDRKSGEEKSETDESENNEENAQ